MSARDVAFTLMAPRERCTASEKALPVAEYRVKLAQLHNDMLDEIARLNAELAAKTDAYRDNIATWMTKYGDKAAECHELREECDRYRAAMEWALTESGGGEIYMREGVTKILATKETK